MIDFNFLSVLIGFSGGIASSFGNNREGSSSNLKFLKGDDFEKGVELKVVGMEKIKANEGFGATIADYLCKEGIIEEGETFRYRFTQETEGEDIEKIYDTKSAVFFISMKECDPDNGDVVKITRTGKLRDTKYNIKKI